VKTRRDVIPGQVHLSGHGRVAGFVRADETDMLKAVEKEQIAHRREHDEENGIKITTKKLRLHAR